MYQDLQAGVYNPQHDPPFMHSHHQSSRTSAPVFGSGSAFSPQTRGRYGHGQSFDSAFESDENVSEVGLHGYYNGDDKFEGGYGNGNGCGNGCGDGCGYAYDEAYNDDEEISPLDQPTPKPTPKYASQITPAQQWAYQSRASDLFEISARPRKAPRLARMVQETNFNFNNFTPNNDNNDNSADEQAQDDEDLRFAYYQVDYHIHLHDRARCNMLTLCRDIDDVRQLRGWEAEMEVLSMGMDLRMDMGLDLGVDTEKPGRCTYDNDGEDDSNPHVHERKETREMWRRSKEDELFRVHQMGLWRRRWRMRQKRVEGVRREWVVLLAKRRRQRKEMLREMQRRRANVRFYGSKAGGDRVLLREVQM